MDIDPWIDDQRLELRGTKFVANTTGLGERDDQFVIIKPPDLVRRYLTLLDEERPASIVEIGVKDGGSTALIALAADPEQLLALDLAAEIPPRLARFIADHDLDGRLITAFGLDQNDRGALSRFVDSHLPAAGFDLVIDDGSHVLGPTRTSFEVLFPRLRPGGLYVIEDWSIECIAATHLAQVIPGAVDFSDRLGAVNQVIHILNAPDHDLPETLRQSMSKVYTSDDTDTDVDTDDLFHLLVRSAGRADASALAALEGEPIGRSRPMADFAVELMMISATNPALVSEVRVDTEWVCARRGTGDLDPETFRLEDAWTDFFGYLS